MSPRVGGEIIIHWHKVTENWSQKIDMARGEVISTQAAWLDCGGGSEATGVKVFIDELRLSLNDSGEISRMVVDPLDESIGMVSEEHRVLLDIFVDDIAVG